MQWKDEAACRHSPLDFTHPTATTPAMIEVCTCRHLALRCRPISVVRLACGGQQLLAATE